MTTAIPVYHLQKRAIFGIIAPNTPPIKHLLVNPSKGTGALKVTKYATESKKKHPFMGHDSPRYQQPHRGKK